MEDEIRINDLLLTAVLIGAAWKALFGREAFAATVFFVAYSLLMAMAWVQLGAMDVALAEACIGAGLTGALLIGAIRQFEHDPAIHVPRRVAWQRLVLALLSAVIFLGTLSSIVELRKPNVGIPPLVRENLGIAGSSHPVTAVLLNFRAFDTWLELGVLLLACIAAIAIHQIYDSARIPAKLRSVQKQPRIIASAMLPLLILVGGVLLWFGSRAPGGAFQAGALLGSAGILLQISGERSLLDFSALRFRLVLLLGFFAFLAVAIFTCSRGGNLLEYPPSLAGTMTLILEVSATFSIALTLNVMYACSHPWKAKQR